MRTSPRAAAAAGFAVPPTEAAGHQRQSGSSHLILAALGVVYGDIGTSPLYALKQCFTGGAEMVTEPRVFGVLSLITWALMVVVTLKYVLVVMRADNRGEGGILALTALALRAASGRSCRWILLFGLLGSALFYGDGVITPAISVLSAVEGLKIATPVFEPYIIPITLALLIVLFWAQSRGTARVGGLFGPVMILWFATLALLGLVEIARNPVVLLALNPLYGIDLLIKAPWAGFALLGAVVLAVTGAEALYADMGHFGARPIRTAWLYFVLPALLLNYFGQGALLLASPDAVENPFYRLAPDWGLYPLVGLASVATIIASQAVISGAFSITHQAVQLGYLPRLRVLHTSEEERGQVYVPRINALLFLAVAVVVLGFQSSDALGAAYGIAVTGTMAITTSLAFLYMRRTAGWPIWTVVPLFALFLLVDLTFFGANLLKILEGGWFPLVVGALVYAVMATWIAGRQRLEDTRAKEQMPLEAFLRSLRAGRVAAVSGTAVYLARDERHTPSALLHNLKHNKVLHERNVLMKVETEDIPHVPEEERLEIRDLGRNFFTLVLRYGFMDEPNIPRALALCRATGFRFNLMETSFFVGREKIVARRAAAWPRSLRSLFVVMHRIALDATEFFRLPPNRVVELGGQIEI
jgi:KUP system potassium uptake protein